MVAHGSLPGYLGSSFVGTKDPAMVERSVPPSDLELCDVKAWE